MPLLSGSRLGPYEIVAPLGAGGMGEVYRARDTRLGRTVAIKVLPERLSSPEMRQRFEREARAISQLSHPHICALYDVGNQDGLEYLVMEHLEGETLSDRLAKGPLPLEQALRCGIEIADALDKAHRHGIVHRDLKPGNVMLTRSGVKLLDFGLAKAIRSPLASGAGGDGLTSLPTKGNLTAEGTILGTFQYMAPEQLEGKEADARTDIFAFGAVLYEMATGRKAFEGKSQASLIAAILEREPPPISAVRPMIPHALDRVVKTCLAKDPEDRWQSAGDVAKELRWVSEGDPGTATLPAERRGSLREWVAWTTAVLLLLGGAYLSFELRRAKATRARPIHSFLVAPEGTAFRLTGDDGGPIVLSPDGERAAFAAGAKLWVQSLRAGTVAPLAGTDGASFPFWSPDSRSIGFFAEGKLKTMEASGGPVTTVCDAPAGRGGSWGTNSVIVFAPAPRSGLSRVPASGGTASPVTRLDPARHTTHRWPFFLPDGKRFLYLAANHQRPRSDQSGIYVGSLDGTENRRLLAGYGSAQYASGWLLTVRDTSLVGQRFAPRTLALSGPPVRIVDDVNFDAGVWRGIFTASEAGLLAFQLGQATAGGQLTWLDLSGRRLATVGGRSEAYAMRLSPDGRRASVILGDPNNDVWIYELDRGVRTRLTRNAQIVQSPQWSPDGSQILFASQTKQDEFSLWTVSSNGGGEQKLLYRSKERIEPTDWSRDGRYVLVDHGEIGATHVWAIRLEDPAKAFPLLQSGKEGGGQFSPDGRWVAYTSRETGRNEIYVMPFPRGGAPWQVSTDGGAQPRWRHDGQELYFVSGDGELMAIGVDGRGPRFEVRDSKRLFRVNLFVGPRFNLHGYDVPTDGKRFLVNAAGEAGQARVTLVENWTAGLEKQ